jgi:hypothetical protein
LPNGGPYYVEATSELLQGDVYLKVPSIDLPGRPVAVARPYRPTGDRPLHAVHTEDGLEPQGGFKWRTDQGGEKVIARGFMGMAVVLTHDCEIENDPDHRLVAMIRSITDIQEAHRASIMAGDNWAAFPLRAQSEAPAMTDSFVDFRRITSIRPEVLLDADRYARLAPLVLDAMRTRFWYFLNRRIVEPPGGDA